MSVKSLSEVKSYPLNELNSIDSHVLFINDVTFEKDIAIMPSAFISCKEGVSIEFKGKVNIFGESQVFDPAARINFAPGTISELNACWFGAKGYDTKDDTEAFQRIFQIAKAYHNSINVYIPIGRYFISETLEVSCHPAEKKSINLLGAAMSNSSVHGSSLSWSGKPGSSMFRFSHMNQFIIENLDFTAEPHARLLHNLEFRPLIHQVAIRNCSFTGVAGALSSNINLNEGDGDQVSEVHFWNCTFNGLPPGSPSLSESGVNGGLANSKNFHFEECAFSAYSKAAIDINITSILRVDGCTFANNEIDISCILCGTYASSNYSEHSKAFFNAGVSSNISFTMLTNNVFVGEPKDGWVIRDGCGSLVLINNDFGGGDQQDEVYRVRWEVGELNSIYSVGNFYKNTSPTISPFCNRAGIAREDNLTTISDTGGKNGTTRMLLKQ